MTTSTGRWRDEAPLLGMIVAMFAAAAVTWPTAPERIPVHWNIHGEVDRWGGRFEGLFLLPLIALGVWALMRFLPLADPGRASYALFAFPYLVIRATVIAFLLAIDVVVHLTIRGYTVDMGRVVPAAVGVLFVVIGAFMGKIRPNWFVGVRTPWTLSSKTSWTRTHRLAGKLFVLAGTAALVAAAVAPRQAHVVILAGTLGAAAISVAYSFAVWRDDPDRIPPAGTLPAEHE